MCYFTSAEEQVFMTNKGRLAKELRKYALIAGVKIIRVHDLRHSHASFLVDQGVTPLLIQERLEHEKIETTLAMYSHLYPNKQMHLADYMD
jgi:Site-specific recombinase XerD